MIWVVTCVTVIMSMWVAAAYLIDDMWMGLIPALALWATIMTIELLRMRRENHEKSIEDVSITQLLGWDDDDCA